VTARDAWPIEADPGQLEQVLLNLAVNARDAMPDGGSLTVETANVVADEQVDGDLPPGEYVLIAVTDSGSGMSEEVKRHAFEPFYTTKPNGTGLGLATAFGVVTQARGRMTVDSEPGRGTTFRIYLPRSPKALPRAAAISPSPLPSGGERVLLVEDHALLRNVAARALEEAGYRVVAAANGHEALLVAARMEEIDILVTDMVMPGMPGTVLAEKLAAERPGVPVLFMSGYSDTPAAADTHFLAKPFTPATLAAKVREVLDRRPVGR
jgi:CheY-like chemotaxis protein